MGVECNALLIIGDELTIDIAILLRIKKIDKNFNPDKVEGFRESMECNDIKNLTNEQLIEHFRNECGDCDNYDIFVEVTEWVEKNYPKFDIIRRCTPYEEDNYYLTYKFETRGEDDSFISLDNIKLILNTIDTEEFSSLYELLSGEKEVQPYLQAIYSVY